MSPLILKKSRSSKGSVSKVSLDRRRQERMCSGDALATPHFAQTGKTLLPWLKEQLLRNRADSGCFNPIAAANVYLEPGTNAAGASSFIYIYPFVRSRPSEKIIKLEALFGGPFGAANISESYEKGGGGVSELDGSGDIALQLDSMKRCRRCRFSLPPARAGGVLASGTTFEVNVRPWSK
ncbi:hypothetical protein AVEN_188852-1 [Araneus ventricosus]|uniref:Uncharacterized protein n=1 Tax=Araneus ventricosus TaxID=182803 RepID=A0A4Y2BVH9_ARAVE|nr:hypothetical protein AVEN_188852-1 [Araneus ventricosus]